LTSTQIRELNDQLRRSLRGGVLVMTAGVIAPWSKATLVLQTDGRARFSALLLTGGKAGEKSDWL
jgi:hypothetical protein